ncbi:hypothetical protein RHS01_03440 [Rhizoctonia solani]|uniref:CCHC-type domain-containing protein n=1 Tax=Rhizoctonia solani TaxID=456999 RepID=A0A8H7IEJ1_9AGAM|nr:hypothetical protein RHS01_03440 [Rhizoctonia solani]
MRWQPAPRALLVPHPLSIKESWDPLFQQPPLSQQALNPRSTGKSPSNKQSPSSWDCKIKSSGSSRNLRKPRKQQRKPKTGWEQSIKPSLALRLGVEPPTHQKTGSPRQSRPRPGPYPKPTLFQRLVCPSLPGPIPPKLPPPLHSQPRLGSPARLYSPSTFAYQALFPQIPQPAAPVATYQTLVKVDHPDAYTGKIGNKACQWLTRMLAWVHLNQQMFPTDQETLLFLLMNMKDVAGAWAHPHLDQLGSHRALIQTVDNFRTEFLAAFGNPDATRAAKQQITHLTQTGTCAEYITKFRTIAMDLDWNNAALQGQFAWGLHWEVSQLIATRERRPTTLLELQNAALVINNALCEERASHPPKGNKSGTSSTTPNRGASTGQQATRPGRLSSNPNFVSKEERNRCRAEGLCIKCGKTGHKFAECRTGWKATPKEESVKKEAAKIGKDANKNAPLFTISIKPEKQAEPLEVLIDSGATSSFLHPRTAKALHLPLIDLPSPCTVTMLDGLSPQAGKIWKKANLTFSFDGKSMTETFLICNTGSHAAILGLKWLDAHNPEIDWNAQTLSFTHTPPEHVAIAKEEEADKNPLEGVPPEYHQYAKVFGEEEFNKLPPHRHYNIGIELTEEGPLNSPLYSMTDAESATLKDWLRDKLKAGKIRPSKSSISSPVMFVPKKDGSHCLLRSAKVFTKLDLRWGYNNVQVKEGNKWKTAFCTKYSLYESLVMTFGLTNTPAAFQHFMNNLFKDLLDVCVIIYLDNILIYSKDDASHTQHVHKVLWRLMINQFLDKLKIQAIQEWPMPTKVKEVQLFLGFANFLQRFVANFSHMAQPCTTWSKRIYCGNGIQGSKKPSRD